MSVVPFYQMGQIVLNSYTPIYSSIIKTEPQITFLNYVKSQLHTNLVTDLYNRDIMHYYLAYKYLTTKDEKFERYYHIVKRYFFQDIGSSIMNCMDALGDSTPDFSMIDEDTLPQDISVEEVYADLERILTHNERVDDKKIDYLEILNKFAPETVPKLEPSKLLAEIVLYMHYAKKGEGM